MHLTWKKKREFGVILRPFVDEMKQPESDTDIESQSANR